MRPLTVEFAVDAVNGKLLCGKMPSYFSSVCTDTRSINKGCLFIALKGERFDGHDYIDKAFQKGAAAAVSQKKIYSEYGAVILVDDTSRALLQLAAAYRRLFDIRVAAVTGSVGKTSTKEMIYSVLSQKYITLKNEGNRNNQIGMPMSVFGLEASHQAAVFEMGMSSFGEISALSKVAGPDIAVITNIGISHIEKLGSREGILKAKMEILDGMAPDGVVVLNGDDEMLMSARHAVPLKTVTYGIKNKNCDAFAEDICEDGGVTRFTLRYNAGSMNASLPVAGIHNVYNALAAFLTGRLLGVAPEQALNGFSLYTPAGMRQKIVSKNGIAFIEDCYNASPDSMAAAFNVLKSVKASGRRIAVLGDMLELGDYSKQAHKNVGKMAADGGVELLFAYGPEAVNYCEGFSGVKNGGNCFYFEDKNLLIQKLKKEVRQGDAVLFKASRAMKFEEIISEIYKEI